MPRKLRLLKAFHPKAFRKNVYAVSFYTVGKPLTDANTKFVQVIAKNKLSAIRKARKELKI